MANVVKITNLAGSVSVDLTQKGVSVSRKGNNTGLIVITIPASLSTDEKGGAFSIDLKMVQDRFDLRFTLTDGIGEHYTPAEGENLSTLQGKTMYERLWYLFKYDTERKYFYWGDDTKASCKFPVVVTELTIPADAGKKNLLENCSMGLQVVNNQ